MSMFQTIDIATQHVISPPSGGNKFSNKCVFILITAKIVSPLHTGHIYTACVQVGYSFALAAGYNV